MSENEHPFPGNKLGKTEFQKKDGVYSEGRFTPVEDAGVDDANILTSNVDLGPNFGGSLGNTKLHRPVLDLDLGAKLVPSTTPGHFHLYLDRILTWDQYVDLLLALARAGILEQGYVGASLSRGYTSVRVPWVQKTEKDTESYP